MIVSVIPVSLKSYSILSYKRSAQSFAVQSDVVTISPPSIPLSQTVVYDCVHGQSVTDHWNDYENGNQSVAPHFLGSENNDFKKHA